MFRDFFLLGQFLILSVLLGILLLFHKDGGGLLEGGGVGLGGRVWLTGNDLVGGTCLPGVGEHSVWIGN